MIGLDDITRRTGAQRIEILTWIERRWIVPAQTSGAPQFDEADVARAALIKDLHKDLKIDEEALSLVLSLLDQLYTARRDLHRMTEILADLPEPLRAQLARHMTHKRDG